MNNIILNLLGFSAASWLVYFLWRALNVRNVSREMIRQAEQIAKLEIKAKQAEDEAAVKGQTYADKKLQYFNEYGHYVESDDSKSGDE